MLEDGGVVHVDNGNVGIGTTTPSHPLHVEKEAGGSSLSHSVLLRLARFTPGIPTGADTPATGIRFDIENSSGSLTESVVSIWAELTNITPGIENGDFSIRTLTDGTKTEKLRILSNGNVGIGTISPSVALEVNGNAIVSSPTANNHVATKEYVDNAVSAAGGGSGLKIIKDSAMNTTTVDCGAGWVVVQCGKGIHSNKGSAETSAARVFNGNNPNTSIDRDCSFTEIGSQGVTSTFASNYNAIMVMCAQQE